MNRIEYIRNRFISAGFNADEAAAAAFDRYAGLLVERNKSVNLTAITEFEDVVTKHFLDSTLLFADDVSRETFFGAASQAASSSAGVRADDVSRETLPGPRIVDVGTGAGFPGLPIKILCPGVRLTMIDSLDKRIRFLDDVIAALSIEGAETVHARAEDAARDSALREAFDVCVSRAVAALPVLCEYCLPFVRVGGVFIAYKAQDCDAETESAAGAIRQLGGELVAVREVQLPGTDATRRFLIIKKVAHTSDRFPRRAGKPEKSPLR